MSIKPAHGHYRSAQGNDRYPIQPRPRKAVVIGRLQQIPAFTDFGLESLTDFIREHKANRGAGQHGSPVNPQKPGP